MGGVGLPTGTVTFMFTDVEGSTTLLHELGDQRFAEVIEAHSAIIRQAIATHDGTDVSSEGDSHFAVFPDPLEAIEAAVRVQRDLSSQSIPVRVRMGLHTGTAVVGGDNYVGVDVHRASRIADSAHGGQVVMSDVTTQLVEGHLPADVSVKFLGRYHLDGFTEPTAIHQLAVDGVDSEFSPLRVAAVESSLPVPLTDFVGRSEELDQGLSILEAHRLLTLTGPGGTGKTRLALELARRAEPRFEDGAFFVPLAALHDAGLIPMTIIETLRLKTAAGVDPGEHLLRHLSQRNSLLVLDNYEQLTSGAHFVSELLGAATGLSIIVTSRSPLRLTGEHELPVPPLEIPDSEDVRAVAETDGVRLFVSRAEAVQPSFQLTEENVATVAAITRSLDGLPLAIELAASRLRTFTPELVLERLGNQLLSAHSADVPQRQQTIVNAIGWSYDLLDDEGKLLFEQLAVFAGSFRFDEAESVVVTSLDIFDGVAEMVEQSLLRQTATAGEPRFRMLTVIKEFAYAALVARGTDRETQDRHAATYSSLAQRANDEILTSKQLEWLGRLSEEHDNLRAAFEHSVATGDATTALGIAASLWRFWQIRGHLAEGRQRLQQALDMTQPADPALRAKALIGLGSLLYWEGDWEGMLPPYREAVDLVRASGTDEELAEALYNLSFGVGYAGDNDSAMALLDESLEISERIGNRLGIARAHWGIGNQSWYEQEWERAQEANAKAIEVLRGVDAPFDLGWAWFMLGHTFIQTEEPDRAREPVGKALEIFAAVEDLSALTLILDVVAVLQCIAGERGDAQYLAGTADRIKSDTGVAIGDVDLNRYPQLVELKNERQGEWLAAYEEGFSASLDVIVARALKALAG